MSRWPNKNGLYEQLHRLSEFIVKTRQELADLRPTEVKQSFLPKATDELDAIVEATASATHRIMDAADVIMRVIERLPAAEAAEATNAVTSIYEACTFQDITGQRVTKIVGVLKVIESRIDKMMSALGDVGVPASAAPEDAPAPSSGSSSQADIDSMFGPDSGDAPSTLDGPALPGKGRSQDEIDALFGDTK
jgi:chemotaxis protein CheZ